jgi:hypothetical protein
MAGRHSKQIRMYPFIRKGGGGASRWRLVVEVRDVRGASGWRLLKLVVVGPGAGPGGMVYLRRHYTGGCLSPRPRWDDSTSQPLRSTGLYKTELSAPCIHGDAVRAPDETRWCRKPWISKGAR